jgi:hypothetical protein
VSLRLSIGVVAAFLAISASAFGATFEVTSEADEGPGSLGETILEAGPGDTIEIPPGTYLLTNGDTLTEQQNVLRGAGPGETTLVPSGGGAALDRISYTGLTVAAPKQPDGSSGSKLETKAQVIALIATLAIFLLIFELVRRRRLVERYALLWMSVAAVLFVLSIWTDGLDVLADAMGIEEPANAIFILAFGTVFLLLLNFSVATSRLSEETKILAQETARLEQELRTARGELPRESGASTGAAGADEPADDRPVGPEDGG